MTDYTDPLKQLEVEIREQAKEVNAGRKPKFGDRMRNPWAGEQNPHRDGFFVRERRVTGRLNPGLWYEMTDGEGAFWSCNGEVAMFVDHLSDAAPQQVQAGEAEREPTGDQLRAIVRSCGGSTDAPQPMDYVLAGWRAALQPQPQAVDEREVLEADLAWHKEALARHAAKLKDVWATLARMIEDRTGKPCSSEPFNDLTATLSQQAKVQEPVMADGVTPLSDYLERAVPDEECGDDWTKGYEECKRRLFKIVGDQLRSMGATAAQQSDTHHGSDHASRPGSQSNAEAAQVVRDKLDSLTVYGNNQQAEAQSKGEKQ